MADPAFQWNEITASQTDADSPIDTTLMEGVRQNLVHLREWLGFSFSPSRDHDHDGINSKSVLLADSVVTAAKLRIARGSFSTSVAGDFYITLNRYSHNPSLQKAGSNYTAQLLMQTAAMASTAETWIALLRMQLENNETCSVYWDYHTD